MIITDNTGIYNNIIYQYFIDPEKKTHTLVMFFSYSVYSENPILIIPIPGQIKIINKVDRSRADFFLELFKPPGDNRGEFYSPVWSLAHSAEMLMSSLNQRRLIPENDIVARSNIDSIMSQLEIKYPDYTFAAAVLKHTNSNNYNTLQPVVITYDAYEFYDYDKRLSLCAISTLSNRNGTINAGLVDETTLITDDFVAYIQCDPKCRHNKKYDLSQEKLGDKYSLVTELRKDIKNMPEHFLPLGNPGAQRLNGDIFFRVNDSTRGDYPIFLYSNQHFKKMPVDGKIKIG